MDHPRVYLDSSACENISMAAHIPVSATFQGSFYVLPLSPALSAGYAVWMYYVSIRGEIDVKWRLKVADILYTVTWTKTAWDWYHAEDDDIGS